MLARTDMISELQLYQWSVLAPRCLFLTLEQCFFAFVLMPSVLYLQNIMKYLLSEAKEKDQASFQKGWKINIIKVALPTTSKCL